MRYLSYKTPVAQYSYGQLTTLPAGNRLLQFSIPAKSPEAVIECLGSRLLYNILPKLSSLIG